MADTPAPWRFTMSDAHTQTMALQPDHRAAARFDTALALDVEGLTARTRNISATGVYFETDIDLPIGSLVNMSVQFQYGGQKHWLLCEGKVVRVTHADGQTGVGARLLTPFFSQVEEEYVASAAKR
jgi:hypothetical protein